jgi:hypothetical protein
MIMARLAVAALLLALASCSSPVTELVVVVDSDHTVPSELDAITIEVTEPSGMVESRTADLGATPLPITLGLTHRGGPLGTVGIVVRGQLGPDMVVTRTIRTSFVAGESRLVRLDLLRRCEDATCSGEETCDENGCVAIDVPGSSLPRFEVVERLDAAPVDAAADDAGPVDAPVPDDAPPDANCIFMSPTETCDTVDQDCDGRIDEGACVCVPECMLDHAVAICTSMRTCAIGSCETGYASCDLQDSTGCERSVRTLTDCGECNRACTSTAGTTSCETGTCRIATCTNPRRGDCDREIATGCETSLDGDERHCGACDSPCDPGETCRMGDCVTM